MQQTYLVTSPTDPETRKIQRHEKERGRKTHKLFQHKLFGPHPKPPIWGPQKRKFYLCLIFWERNAKEAHKHKLFQGILGVKSGGPQTLRLLNALNSEDRV